MTNGEQRAVKDVSMWEIEAISSPRRAFALASKIRVEALALQSQGGLQSEVHKKYKALRCLLEQTIRTKQLFYGVPHVDPGNRLGPEEGVLAYLWLAEILAYDLDDDGDLFRADEICECLAGPAYGAILKQIELPVECYNATSAASAFGYRLEPETGGNLLDYVTALRDYLMERPRKRRKFGELPLSVRSSGESPL